MPTRPSIIANGLSRSTAKVADGVLSPKQQEEEATKLKTKEEELRKFEADSQQKLAAKQQELVQPILDKVNKAIQDVAKENGYQFIFDEAVLLYRDPTLDIGKLVRAKLGIQ
ncbi:MAG: OmpH family outer membrane protein [Saprospiraceae bacterium]|nr:OmpH family outer membrane protein [Saprospiraceae bacterium]